MSRSLPSYLTSLRLQRGLTQPELADLLGIGPSLLSKVETLDRRPTARVILAAEIVFGVPARDIFPGAYHVIESAVVQRARNLRGELKGKSDPTSVTKRQLVKELTQRASTKGL